MFMKCSGWLCLRKLTNSIHKRILTTIYAIVLQQAGCCTSQAARDTTHGSPLASPVTATVAASSAPFTTSTALVAGAARPPAALAGGPKAAAQAVVLFVARAVRGLAVGESVIKR
jgi:hypothetical protein